MNKSSQASPQLYTAQQVRKMDAKAIQQLAQQGIENASFALMQRAGERVFAELKAIFSTVDNQIHVFCGAGNNAGDGYIVASCALKEELSVRVYALGEVSKLEGDALKAYQVFKSAGGQLSELPVELHLGVVIDALLGIGLDRPVTGGYQTAINLINRSSLPVLAVDIASGLNANTGCAMGAAVKASQTISFIALKRGLYTADGPELSGKIVLDKLNLPAEDRLLQTATAELIPAQLLPASFKPRLKNSHKGSYGHALLVGGAAGFSGAVSLAGEASLRVGAGVVSIATRAEHAAVINSHRLELMCHGVTNRQQLQPLIKQASVVALGPGLGQSRWAKELFEAAIETNKPLVLDADALNLLCQSCLYGGNHILTPHPGEAARLLNCTVAEVQQDRFAAIKAIQEKYKGVVILKGSGSLLYDGEGTVKICQAGNPGMASAGMGDVLTGVITGLLAQGYGLRQAAIIGLLLHATAGDRAAKKGERGLLAGDLFGPLRQLVNEGVADVD